MTLKSSTYQEAMDRLEVILKGIDESTVGIDELAEKVDEAAGLLKHCREILMRTESRVQITLAGLQEDFNAADKQGESNA